MSASIATIGAVGGFGGSSVLGPGAKSVYAPNSAGPIAGSNASGYGGGGGGAAVVDIVSSQAGGAGVSGYVYITEYCNQ